jgi:hypothetical protein
LIRRTWYAGCARCCDYLPIACFARWGACPSKAYFGQFSLLSIGSRYSDLQFPSR